MKKSELKTLIRHIVNEVRQAKLGASTMKKSPDKKENTQMGYEDKTITSTSNPTEKKEGKKLPVVQKKSNTKLATLPRSTEQQRSQQERRRKEKLFQSEVTAPKD